MKELKLYELENVSGGDGSGIYNIFYGAGRVIHQSVNGHAEHRRKYGYNPYA